MMIISHGHHVMTMVMMMKIMMMMNVAGGRWAAAEAWAAQASQTIIILYIGISVLVIVIIIIGQSFIMSRVQGPPNLFLQIFISIFDRPLRTFVIDSIYKAKTTRRQLINFAYHVEIWFKYD